MPNNTTHTASSASVSQGAKKLTSIGCEEDSKCGCTPASIVYKLPDAIKGVPYSASIPIQGTKPVTAEVLFTSDGITAVSDGAQIKVTGTPTHSVTVLIKLSNECSDCEHFTLKATVKDPCIPIVVTMPQTITVGVPNAVPITGTNIVVTNLVSPASTVFAIEDGYLKFNSSNAGVFKVKLSNACSEQVIDGEFTKVAGKVCIPVSYKGEVGNSIFTEGVPANYQILLNGTAPITIAEAPQDLQNGLTYAITEVNGQVAISITGTPQKLPCDDNGKKECKAYCFVVENECGKTRICKTLSYAGLSNAPTVDFCVGMVNVVASQSTAPAGAQCFDVTAQFFPPNTSVYISTALFNTYGTNNDFAPFEPNQTPAGAELEIALDGQGYGTKTVCVPFTSTGCFFGSLQARHPTCGIISSSTAVGLPIAFQPSCSG